MLTNINFLYLGLRVFIICDRTYLGRFWTQFEAWLSMQMAQSSSGRSAARRFFDAPAPLLSEAAPPPLPPARVRLEPDSRRHCRVSSTDRSPSDHATSMASALTLPKWRTDLPFVS